MINTEYLCIVLNPLSWKLWLLFIKIKQLLETVFQFLRPKFIQENGGHTQLPSAFLAYLDVQLEKCIWNIV